VKKLGSLPGLHARIEMEGRDDESLPYYPGTSYELWWDGAGRARIETWGYWGDASRWVCDGKALLQDPLSSGAAATLQDAQPLPIDPPKGFPARQSYANPLVYFLSGEKGFDKLISKESSIKSTPNGYLIEGKEFGKLTILVSNGLPSQFTFDNRPYLEEMYKQFPEFSTAPTSPSTVIGVKIVSTKKQPESVFSTVLPKGVLVSDERAKPKG